MTDIWLETNSVTYIHKYNQFYHISWWKTLLLLQNVEVNKTIDVSIDNNHISSQIDKTKQLWTKYWFLYELINKFKFIKTTKRMKKKKNLKKKKKRKKGKVIYVYRILEIRSE